MSMLKIARSFKKAISLMLVFTFVVSMFSVKLFAAVPLTIVAVGSVNAAGQAVVTVRVDYGTITGHLGAGFNLTFNDEQLKFVSSSRGTGLDWAGNVVPEADGNLIIVSLDTLDEINQNGHVLWTGIFDIIDNTLDAGDEISGFTLTVFSFMDEEWDMPDGIVVDISAIDITIPDTPLEKDSIVVAQTTDTTTIPGLTLLAIDVSSIAGRGEIVLIVQYTEGASTPVRNYRRVNVTPDVTTVNMGIVTGAAAQISVWAVSVDANVDFTSTESVVNNDLIKRN